MVLLMERKDVLTIMVKKAGRVVVKRTIRYAEKMYFWKTFFDTANRSSQFSILSLEGEKLGRGTLWCFGKLQVFWIGYSGRSSIWRFSMTTLHFSRMHGGKNTLVEPA